MKEAEYTLVERQTAPPDVMDYITGICTYVNEIWQNMFFDAFVAQQYRGKPLEVEALM